jgi:hypothetical protein
MDVAGRARAATAAQCQQFVKAIVADDFHQAQAIFSLNFAALAIARNYCDFSHENAP